MDCDSGFGGCLPLWRIREKLVSARRYIERGWCRNDDFKTVNNRPTNDLRKVHRVSLNGACCLASPKYAYDVLNYLESLLGDSVDFYNDYCFTDKRQVLRFLDKAIESTCLRSRVS
jgi:hypothetical protein